MKQKLAIACALIHTPSALLLDEPLTGLDPVGIRRMKATILHHARSGPRSSSAPTCCTWSRRSAAGS